MPTTAALIHVLRAAAANGDDVIAVTSAVAALDDHHQLDVEHLRTKVGLHPQWVMGQQAADVAHAIFAVVNCHDDDALLTIARTSTRITVLKAVGSNRHASQETKLAARANMFVLQEQARPAQVQRAQARQAPQGDVALPDWLNVFGVPTLSRLDPLNRFSDRARSDDATPEIVDALVDFALELSQQNTVERIFADCYSRAYVARTPIWAMMTRHPVELLELLPGAVRSQILNNAVNQLYYSGEKPNMFWDLRLAKAIVERSHLGNLRDCESFRACGPVFTPAAYSYMLTQPKWRKLALAHLPNPRQLKTLLATMAVEKADDELWQKIKKDAPGIPDGFFADSRALFLMARDYRGPGHDLIPKDALKLETAASVASGPGDELFVKALESASSVEIAGFIGDGLSFDGAASKYPEIASLEALAARLDSSPETFNQLRRCGLYQASPEYVKAVVDVIPILWECAITNQSSQAVVMSQLLDHVALHKVAEALGQELAPMTLPQVLAHLH